MCKLHTEGSNAQLDNKCKYDIGRKFLNDYISDKFFIVGYTNGHIFLLEERMNR